MSRIVVSRIVAAVDATPRSAPVLRFAAHEADLTGSRVLALTATGGSERWVWRTSQRLDGAAEPLSLRSVRWSC